MHANQQLRKLEGERQEAIDEGNWPQADILGNQIDDLKSEIEAQQEDARDERLENMRERNGWT